MCARDAGSFTVVIEGLETLLDDKLMNQGRFGWEIKSWEGNMPKC